MRRRIATPTVWQLTDPVRQAVLVPRVTVARTPWRRALGLLGRRALAAGEGLWLEPCAAVHTWGMRFAIDAVFLDAGGTVMRVVTLSPWRMVWTPGARSVLELSAGAAAAAGLDAGRVVGLARTDAAA